MRGVNMNRRELLWGASTMLGASALVPISIAQSSTRLSIDGGRLQAELEGLSEFGRPANGSFADGVSRVAYSDADVSGREYVLKLMRTAGLEPRIDTAGNIFGRRDGSDGSLKPILFGSHIDSVPSGGNFDGDLGSLAAIEVIRVLKNNSVTTRHPLEVVIWSNEEGGTVGSRATIGDIHLEDLDRMFNGVRMRDGVRKIGGDPDRLGEARIKPGAFHCYRTGSQSA
jgi:N-carbamoyl-L-amino-acid hydrolase